MKALLTSIIALAATLTFAQTNTETEILALSKKRVQWLMESKVDSLAMLYDDNSITIHGNGLIKSTKEHLDDVRNGRPTYKSIDIKESTVRDFGATAILVGKGFFSITINGQDMAYNMVYTEVYIKNNKAWKLVSRQASTMQ